MVDEEASQPPIRPIPPGDVLPSVTAPAGDRPHAAGGGGQYLARAKLRIQQVQVALRVLNALTTGLAAQPGDVEKLKTWADPSRPACSTRELAQRIVECAAQREGDRALVAG
jgi:hypothetical protein